MVRLVLVGTALLGAPPAQAATPAWFEQPVIATAEPAIVSAPSGAAVATWTRRDSDIRLVASTRSPRGGWSAPIVIVSAPAGAREIPVPFRAAIDQAGGARILWGWAPDRSKKSSGDRPAEPLTADPSRLRLSTLLADGPRTAATLGGVAASTRLLALPQLTVLADGSAVVSAILEPVAPNGRGNAPDLLVAAVQRPGQEPVETVLERDVAGYASLSALAEAGGAATIAVSGWRQPVTSYATTITTFRWTTDGGWSRSSESADESLGLFSMTAGAGDSGLTSLVGESGSGLLFARLGPGGQWLRAPKHLPAPPSALTVGGTLGGGRHDATAQIERDDGGRTVLAGEFAPASRTGEWPSYGLSALWAYTEVAPDRWQVDPVDPDADLSGGSDVRLIRNAAGALHATWTMSAWRNGTCGDGIFRADRSPGGAWSTRRMLVYWPGCQGTVGLVESIDGSDAFSWSLREGTLRAEPLPAQGGVLKTFAPTVRSHTAVAMRRRGGLAIDCRPTGFGLCTASVLRAAGSASGADRAALRCLDAASTSAVDTSSSVVLVRLQDYCLPRGRPFPSAVLRVAFDAPGQPVQTKLVRLRGGR